MNALILQLLSTKLVVASSAFISHNCDTLLASLFDIDSHISPHFLFQPPFNFGVPCDFGIQNFNPLLWIWGLGSPFLFSL